LSLGQIKLATDIYERSKKCGDWSRELESLSALKLLYIREGDRVKDVRRIVAIWKKRLEEVTVKYRKVMSRQQYQIYRNDYVACLKYESEYLFESFLVYMELNRKKEERFYPPRKKVFEKFGIIESLQKLADGQLDILAISCPPRFGKSGLGLFFNAFMIGKTPNKAIFASGHTSALMNSFYDAIVKLTTSDEYNYKSIFPLSQLISTDAKQLKIDYGEPMQYKSISFRSIDQSMSGHIEASSLLYVDDLIENVTEARKPDRLLSAYTKYEADIKQRRKQGVPQVPILMIGTRWSLNDPIGVESRRNADNPRAKFIVIPALDENGESNLVFDYDVGFTKKFYEETKEYLDNIDPSLFASIYQQQPVESEGICFKESDLKKYNGELPRDNHYGVYAFIDVAYGGGDSVSMPIGDVFTDGDNKAVFVKDWVFTRSGKEISIPLIVEAIMKNGVRHAKFEANNGGQDYAEAVKDELRKMGYACEVTWEKATTAMAKNDKILYYASDIKDFFRFLNESARPQPYKLAIWELTSWLRSGDSPHDDAPDSLAGLSEMVLGKRTGYFTVIDRTKGGL
jgi:hypothetical protein